MFERFTDDARQVVHRAQEHARRLHHGWVGCEHLLLGVAEAECPAGALLRDRGAQPHAIEEAVAAVIGPGPGDGDDKVALALLARDDTAAWKVLRRLGIDPDGLRREIEAGSDDCDHLVRSLWRRAADRRRRLRHLRSGPTGVNR